MHIVHFEDFFHPSAGYKYNILSKYMVQYGHKVTIVTAKLDNENDNLTRFFGKKDIEKLDKEFANNYGVNIIRLNVKKFIRTRAVYNIKDLIKSIKELKPDIVSFIMEQIPAYYYILNYKKNSFPIVLDNHMVKSASQTPLSNIYHLWHRLFITPIIKRNDIRVIRCVYDNYINECLGLPLENSPIVSFGSDLKLFSRDEMIKKKFRIDNNIQENSVVFIYMGKLDEAKGGDLLAKAFVERFNTEKDIYLIVVGNNNANNKQIIEDNFKISKNRILRYPTQKYVNMPYYYQVSDVAIFPKQCSLSFFDAQACGLPVIAEEDNINSERLSHNNGFTFKKGDIKSFRDAIQKFIDISEDEKKALSNNSYNFIKENYDYEKQAKKYMNILIEEYNKFYKNEREAVQYIV